MMKLLHKVIFWSHLLAGVSAGLIIFSMSFTGVMLTYEPQIAEYSERGARRVTPSPDAKRLSYDELIAKIRAANPAARPAMIMVKSDPGASVSVNLGRDNTIFVNPYNGEILGSQSPTHNFLRDIVDWHRWLGVEGEGRATARAITGACNLAFFWLAITGVYLWWPPSWHWRALKHSFLFNPRLRGKARDWNWHNVIGFWSSSMLVVLTLTAAVMSYPWANDLLYTLTGSEPPRRAEGPAGVASERPRGRGQRGEGQTRSAGSLASVDVLLARAQEQVPGWVMIMLRFPPRGDGPVTASIQGPDAFHPFQRSQLTLNRATGEVLKWEPYADNSAGRKLRTWVRALHTGEAFGFAGQTVAGLASLGGCFLVWTGLAMAWRRLRSWRHQPEDSITIAITPKLTEGKISMSETSFESFESIDAPLTQTLSAPQIDFPRADRAGRHAHAEHDDARVRWSTASFDGDAVLILYATVTGNAETLANKLAAIVRCTGRTTQVRDMAHCQANVLSEAGWVLVVTSTYGDGEPPDDAAPFWHAVVHGNGMDLRGVKFSVLALGNTTFDHFCKCGRELDAALERHGATRFYPRVDCDADYDAPAKSWITGVLASLELENRAAASA
jgi:uncharacterized iron-regulated membrane protein/flavodoxin